MDTSGLENFASCSHTNPGRLTRLALYNSSSSSSSPRPPSPQRPQGNKKSSVNKAAKKTQSVQTSLSPHSMNLGHAEAEEGGRAEDEEAASAAVGAVREPRRVRSKEKQVLATRRAQNNKIYQARRAYLGKSYEPWAELRQRKELNDAELAAYLLQVERKYRDDCRSSPLNDNDPVCEHHQNEKINIFCVNCEVATCSLCKVFGVHKGCDVVLIQNAIELQKTKLNNCIPMVAAKNEALLTIINQVEINSQQVKLHLDEAFRVLKTTLEEQKTKLMDHVTKVKEDKLCYLKNLIRENKNLVERSSKMVESTESMAEEGKVNFLQSSTRLIKMGR